MSGNFNQTFWTRRALRRSLVGPFAFAGPSVGYELWMDGDDGSDYYDGDYAYDEDTDFEQAVGDCYSTGDGYCGAAGSEYCDFECPFNR